MLRSLKLTLLLAALPMLAVAQTPTATPAPAAPAEAAAATPAAATAPVPESLRHYLEVKNDKKTYFTVVCLGDSNTEVNWTSRGHLNWVGLVTAGLFESAAIGRCRVVNSGFSGDTAKKALDRLDRDVLAYNPDLVIITYGTNDSMKSTPAETRESLHAIITRIREKFPQCSLLLRTPQPVYIVDEGLASWGKEPEFVAVIEAIREVAREDNIALVDHYALWTAEGQPQPPQFYAYDRLHANENGHLRFYNELAPVLDLRPELRWMKKK